MSSDGKRRGPDIEGAEPDTTPEFFGIELEGPVRFARVKAGGWAAGERLTEEQLNQLDLSISVPDPRPRRRMKHQGRLQRINDRLGDAGISLRRGWFLLLVVQELPPHGRWWVLTQSPHKQSPRFEEPCVGLLAAKDEHTEEQVFELIEEGLGLPLAETVL